MCLIVSKIGKNATFSEEQFKRMISQNGHGLGIMYIENDRIKVEKTVGTDAEKLALYKRHSKRTDYAMHARWKTHGNINVENCHPYKILDIDDGDAIDMYMMHNGVISAASDTDKSMSDTWNFVESVLKPIAKVNPDLVWNNTGIHELISEFIGGGSKLLFMRSDSKESLIFNEKAGNIFNGCWLSNANCNHTYTTTTHHTTYGNFTNNKHNTERDDYTSPWWSNKRTKKNKNALTVIEAKKTESALEHEWNEGEQCQAATSYSVEKTDKKPDGESLKNILTTTSVSAIHDNNLKEAHQEKCIALQCLKAMSDKEMIAEMQALPKVAAELIEYFYNVKIDVQAMVTEILDDKTVIEVVNLMRHLTEKTKLAA